jgi:hypothetical protein
MSDVLLIGPQGEFAYGRHRPQMGKILRTIHFILHVFMLAEDIADS